MATTAPTTATTTTIADLARNWWAVALRGALAVLFGLVAFIWPGITLGALVLLFGAYALVDGIFAFVAAFRAADRGRQWWPFVLEGLVGVAAGVIAVVWPGLTAVTLVYLIAAWAVITGLFEIVAAVRLRREIENEWLLVLAGVLSVLFGLAMFLFPGAGALALVWIIGGYAVVFGVLLIALGLQLRTWQSRGAPEARAADTRQPARDDARGLTTDRAA
jgi:uncharacterized membrane protein HdeD (DUF308 family)